MNAPASPSAVPVLAAGVTAHRTVGGVCRLRSAPLPRQGLHRLLARWLRLPDHVELELDDIGTWVVERLDGRDLSSLAGELATHLKLTRREAEVALGDFLRQLAARHLVLVQVEARA